MSAALDAPLQSDFERLLIRDALRHLPGIPITETDDISFQSLVRLISAASVLSMDEDSQNRTTAYEIATRAAALRGLEFAGIVRAAELILSRLGNFPGRDLLRSRFPQSAPQDFLCRLEMRVRELENTEIDAGGTSRRLTDFQFESLHRFGQYREVSISAPTSAGKSFILSLEVLRKLRGQRPAGIAYLVPTRALIRQVVVDLRKLIAESSFPSPLIRSIPKVVSRDEALNGIIYVLTQERLLSLLTTDEGSPWLTALIVDEAQGIGDGSRGVLLHTAIESTLTRFPGIEVIFASPLAKNPEYLLKIFDCRNGEPYGEQHSPVAQNLFLIESRDDDPRNINCTLLFSGKRLFIGDRTLKHRFHGLSSPRRLALFARAISEADSSDSCCIVYANGARTAERIARHLRRGARPLDPLDPDIEEFISYLSEYVHPDYGLTEFLRYGIAFHYSTMPGNVRAGIEDLFRQRKLQFICCTSTLLQGVNLPAKHIVIEAPEKGKKKPMQRADFLNLAGRAGRLTREFHGNVWCLRPDTWETRCFEGEPLQQIRSAFDRVVEDRSNELLRAFENDLDVDDPETTVSALGRVFTEFVQKDRPLITSALHTQETIQSLQEVTRKLKQLRAEVRLDPAIFARNSGVHPRRLETLYSYLLEQTDLDAFCPIRPMTKGTNVRLGEIFQRVEQFFSGVGNDSYKYHCKFATSWVHEKPLSVIIANEISYRKSHQERERGKPVRVRDIIHDVIKTIEQIIRFRYVKHLRAYNDVLAQALHKRGDHEEANALVPFHLYLECGAHKPVTLSLISLGLTRATALFLSNRIVLPAEATPEECLKRCRQAIANAQKLKVPITMQREIAAVAGT